MIVIERLPMLDEGGWAEIRVGEEHLRLFSEHNAQGVQASVYNVNAKNWIAPSEIVDDIEQGKDRVAAHALLTRKAAGWLNCAILCSLRDRDLEALPAIVPSALPIRVSATVPRYPKFLPRKSRILRVRKFFGAQLVHNNLQME